MEIGRQTRPWWGPHGPDHSAGVSPAGAGPPVDT